MKTLLLLCFASLLLVAARPASATEVWSGRTHVFSKVAFANPALPQNQDSITPLVKITRGNTMGIYNIAQEASYVTNVSPAGTAWATGDAADHASLTFNPWQIWTGGNPGGTIGVNAVVHLVAEDIYVDIVFDSFGGAGTGGPFSYRRAVSPSTPTMSSSWGRVKKLYR